MILEKFHIGKLSKSNLLIVPNSYLRIDEYISDLEEYITKEYFEYSELYFDFLIKNGPNDRFYKAKLLNGKIVCNSFKKIEVSIKIEKKSNIYFSKNLYLLNDSLMNKAQKFLLKKRLSAFI